MPPPYSYNFWQQIIPALRFSWTCPPGDNVSDRWVDRSRVQTAEAFPWPSELRDQVIGFDATQVPWEGSIAGIPIQRVPATNRLFREWTENNTYTGIIKKIRVPRPIGNVEWLEGNPNIQGAWDHHVLLVCPETAESWEMIGCNVDLGTCLAYAYYRNGRLLEGMPVIAGQASMPAYLLGRNDPPHRMGIVMTDYVGWDGTKPASSGWPRCGDVFRLRPDRAAVYRARADQEQMNFLNAAEIHGFFIYDRGGRHSFGQQAGARWATSTLRNLRITYGDLERVTSSSL